jgi:adenosylcobinamide-GDP ribazoletransferase
LAAILSQSRFRPKGKNPDGHWTASVIVTAMSAPNQSTRGRTGLLAGFSAAIAFLTRIPTAAPAEADCPLAEAAWAFPLVGAGIGAVAAFVFVAAQLIGLGDWPSALLAVLAGLLLTGALHEDGLADAADGLFGGGNRERRLAIMRDSRHGTFAVLALVLSVSLRAAALAQIGQVVFAGLALVVAHAGSRALLPIVMWALPPARDDGLGAGAGRPRPVAIIAAMLIALAISAAALGPGSGLVTIAFAAAAAAGAAAIACRRIGGYTGDILGAVQQVGEIAILLIVLAAR